MAFDAEAARADGYTEEEIQQYLATRDQPLPADTPRDRTEEQLGVVASSIPDVVKYGLEAYAGKKLIIDPLSNAIRNRGAMPPTMPPTTSNMPAPTTFTGGANPEVDRLLSRPHPQSTPLNFPANQPPAPPSSANYMQRMTQLAERYMPVVSKMARAAGPVAAMGTGLFYTSPEEIATLKAAEERRRQQQMMQPR